MLDSLFMYFWCVKKDSLAYFVDAIDYIYFGQI